MRVRRRRTPRPTRGELTRLATTTSVSDPSRLDPVPVATRKRVTFNGVRRLPAPPAPDATRSDVLRLEDLMRPHRRMLFVRWVAAPWVFLQLFAYREPWPSGLFGLGVAIAVVLALGNLGLWLWGRTVREPALARVLAVAGLAFDVLVASAFVWLFAFDQESALWAILFILPLEGAIRFQLKGALWTWTAVALLYVARELWG